MRVHRSETYALYYIHSILVTVAVPVPVPYVDWKIAVNSTSIGLYLLFLFLSNETLLSTWETILSRKIPSSPGCVCAYAYAYECVCVCLDCIQQSFYDLLWPDMSKDFPRCCPRATKMAHLTRTTESKMHIVKSRKTYKKEIRILCSNSTDSQSRRDEIKQLAPGIIF